MVLGGSLHWIFQQIIQKTSKEKSVKKGSPQQKKDIAGSVKPGKPPARKYGFICPAGRVGADR